MDNSSESTYAELHRLVTGQIEAPSSKHLQALARRLEGDPDAQGIYLQYMQETVDLRWALRGRQPMAEQFDLLCDCQLSDVSSTSSPERTLLRKAPPVSPLWLATAFVGGIAALWLFALVMPVQEEGSQAALHVASEPTVGSSERVVPRVAPANSSPLLQEAVATFQQGEEVEWASDTHPLGPDDRLTVGQELTVVRGEIQIRFDSDVTVAVRAPSRFRITSANSLFSWQGAYSAHVGESGKGFTIETPTTQVLDLGTEFGVLVGPYGETDVAVIQGKVDLAYGEFGNSLRDRLIQGEGLRVKNGGEVERLVSFDSGDYPIKDLALGASARRQPLIAGVRDNIRTGESKKYYKINRSGLHEDSLAFVDRSHEWNGLNEQGLPRQLLGGEYIMPFNDHKFAKDLEVQIDIARPAVVYLLVSDLVSTPEWLVRDFKDTGLDIGLDEGANRFKKYVSTAKGSGMSIDTRFSVWSRAVGKPKTIRLGAVEHGPDRQEGHNMYGIVAVPLDSI